MEKLRNSRAKGVRFLDRRAVVADVPSAELGGESRGADADVGLFLESFLDFFSASAVADPLSDWAAPVVEGDFGTRHCCARWWCAMP